MKRFRVAAVPSPASFTLKPHLTNLDYRLHGACLIPPHEPSQRDPALRVNTQNECVCVSVFLSLTLLSLPQLNVTDDSDLPQDMIVHFCQFREFYLTPVGVLDEEQLDNRVFGMTVMWCSLLTP